MKGKSEETMKLGFWQAARSIRQRTSSLTIGIQHFISCQRSAARDIYAKHGRLTEETKKKHIHIVPSFRPVQDQLLVNRFPHEIRIEQRHQIGLHRIA